VNEARGQKKEKGTEGESRGGDGDDFYWLPSILIVEGCEDAGSLLRCTHPIDYSQSVGSSQTAGLPGLVQKASQGCGCDAQELPKWKRVATRRKA